MHNHVNVYTVAVKQQACEDTLLGVSDHEQELSEDDSGKVARFLIADNDDDNDDTQTALLSHIARAEATVACQTVIVVTVPALLVLYAFDMLQLSAADRLANTSY